MYRLDWIEQRKLRIAKAPTTRQVARVSPVVWKLGWTSFLTDISAEMVSSALPVYVVLHLHLGPVQFGAIDGIYNGVAVALLSLGGGVLADRTRRHREVAFAGYAVSAVCKLLLLLAGGAWGWITAIVAVDRTAKGARTSPRDSLLSLHSSPELLASAFAIHRAMDAGGSLLGPMVAFSLMAWLPGAFDAIWVTSFVFALLGLTVLWLFVPNPPIPVAPPAASPSLRAAFRLLRGARFRALAVAGAVLSAFTVSDAFLYLILQQKSGLAAGMFPMLYVITACCYMMMSIPVGRLADRWGREPVFLLGYVTLGFTYLLVFSFTSAGWASTIACLVLLGLYYAATEGILMAMASAVTPAELRTSGLALLATFVGLGKMIASLLFGVLWSAVGTGSALLLFGIGLAAALVISTLWLRWAVHEAR